MRRVFALACVTVCALVVTGVSSAARIQQQLTCTGGVGTIAVTVTSTSNDHSVAWGTGKVSSSLHGIPVSFAGTATDLTTGQALDSFSFFQAKGQGNGMHNQPTVTCSSPPQTDTAGDLGVPAVDPGDMIQFAFSAQVVLQP